MTQNSSNTETTTALRLPSIPVGAFQLTPQIAATLKIPYPGGGATIIPQLMIEFINISVIKSTSNLRISDDQFGTGLYDVILTSQLTAGSEVLVAYPNQPIIWQGREDGPERTFALNKLVFYSLILYI